MKELLLILISLLFIVSCKKKESGSIIDEWKVNSMLESGDTLTIFAANKIEIHFNSNKTLELFGDSIDCATRYDIEEGALLIDSLICSASPMFERKLIKNLHKVNNFDVQGNTLFLYGYNQLTIKCLK
jgi:hypothetical protein